MLLYSFNVFLLQMHLIFLNSSSGANFTNRSFNKMERDRIKEPSGTVSMVRKGNEFKKRIQFDQPAILIYSERIYRLYMHHDKK